MSCPAPPAAPVPSLCHLEMFLILFTRDSPLICWMQLAKFVLIEQIVEIGS